MKVVGVSYIGNRLAVAHQIQVKTGHSINRVGIGTQPTFLQHCLHLVEYFPCHCRREEIGELGYDTVRSSCGTVNVIFKGEGSSLRAQLG